MALGQDAYMSAAALAAERADAFNAEMAEYEASVNATIDDDSL
jgi:hypothetical protein